MIPKELKAERLKTLYQVMGGIPKEVIDLEQWRSHLGYFNVSDETLIWTKGCGTNACALGWACAYPEFKKQGLSYNSYTPKYLSYDGFDAGEMFFGITEKQSEALFSAPEHAKPNRHKQIFLRRLRRLMVSSGIITKERSDELAAEEMSGKFD